MPPLTLSLSLFLLGAVVQLAAQQAELTGSRFSLETRTNDTSAVATQQPCVQNAARDSNPKIVRLTLGTVPAILRIPARIARPAIILWHGFATPDNEAELMEALPLDEIAAVKVCLGLPIWSMCALR